MKILDVLRKLGILRYGATAKVYRNAGERPAEFMMDDVFNAEKDLVTEESGRPPVAAGGRSAKRKQSSYQSQDWD